MNINLNYQEITGVENIRFRSNPSKHLYQRTFWGLEKSNQKSAYKGFDLDQKELLIDELKNYVNNETLIDRAILSPNQDYIVYREIESNYFNSNESYDEYCYYKIYDRKTKKSQIIYEGYQEWFDLEWK